MPTDKQLFDSWNFQTRLRLSNEQIYCQDHNSEYQPAPQENEINTGEEVGVVVYDPQKKELFMKLDQKNSSLENKL